MLLWCVQELMRQQKAADACIDALRRKRPNTKPQPVVGTISKPPPAFPVFVGLDDEDPQSDLGPGSVPPKVSLLALRHAAVVSGQQNPFHAQTWLLLSICLWCRSAQSHSVRLHQSYRISVKLCRSCTKLEKPSSSLLMQIFISLMV